MESITAQSQSPTLSSSQETFRMECEARTKSKPLPSKELLMETFFYRDGNLFWKKRSKKRNIGDMAGWIEKNGYVGCSLNGSAYRLHRLIYQMHHGNCPDIIDHINGDISDNRIENLRPATSQQNNFNRRAAKINKLGTKGVCIERGKFKANIKFNGKSMHLGYFDNLEDASLAYQKKSIELFGEYAWMMQKKKNG